MKSDSHFYGIVADFSAILEADGKCGFGGEIVQI